MDFVDDVQLDDEWAAFIDDEIIQQVNSDTIDGVLYLRANKLAFGPVRQVFESYTEPFLVENDTKCVTLYNEILTLRRNARSENG